MIFALLLYYTLLSHSSIFIQRKVFLLSAPTLQSPQPCLEHSYPTLSPPQHPPSLTMIFLCLPWLVGVYVCYIVICGGPSSSECRCRDESEVCAAHDGSCQSGCREGWGGTACHIGIHTINNKTYTHLTIITLIPICSQQHYCNIQIERTLFYEYPLM